MKYSVKLNRKRTVSRNDAELSTKKEAERERQLNKLGKLFLKRDKLLRWRKRLEGEETDRRKEKR